MANEDKILKILLQIQSDLSDLGKFKSGLEDLKKTADDTAKSGFSLGDAFKFAGAEEALDGVLEALKRVGEEIFEVVKSSVEKAAEIQAEEFPLTKMLQDSGEAAEEILGRVNSLWQQFGVVSNQSLSDAARNLIIMGTPAENLVTRLTELTKISIGTGTSLGDVVSAYMRLRTAIENETEPMTRGMGGFGAATTAMLKLLQESMGKTRDEILSMFRQGEISLPELLHAFQEATTGAGKFADVITEKRALFEGAVEAMKTAWEGLEVELGKPLIEAITPLINKITDLEKGLAQIAQQQGWQTALTVAWRIVVDEMAQILVEVLGQTFTNIGPAFVRAFFQGFVEELKYELTGGGLKDLFAGNVGAAAWGSMGGIFAKAFADSFGSQLLGNLNIDIDKARQMLNDALKQVTGEDTSDKVEENLGHVQKKVNEVSIAVRELETVLQSIRQQQQIITQNPLISVDDKNQQLIKSYTAEIAALTLEIEKLKGLKAGGGLDQAQLAEVDQKLQQANAQVQLLTLKLTGLSQPLRAELVQWVNSFGTAAQQIAKTIEGTINSALQGTNQLLLDAVFRTGDWRQTLMGVERQILNLFLTFLEQMALQRLAALLNISTVTTAKVASGVAIAASNAPAAAASSIATDGVSAVEGESLALAAISAIEGALVAHEGGYIKRKRYHGGGGLAHDEVPIIGQEGEVMIQRSVAQQPGMTEFLLALNAGAFFHGGGRLGRHGRGRGGRGRHGRGPQALSTADEWLNHFLGEGPTDPFTEPHELPEPNFGTPSTVARGDDPNTGGSDFGPINYDPWGYLGNAYPGMPWSPTLIPTTYDPAGYPYAVPVVSVTNPTDPTGLLHAGQQLHSRHSGGLISKYHVGGAISRMHSGGSVGTIGNALRGGGVHVYAFTDLKEVIRHMGSKQGQKIIFDTIKGRRIDLGLG